MFNLMSMALTTLALCKIKSRLFAFRVLSNEFTILSCIHVCAFNILSSQCIQVYPVNVYKSVQSMYTSLSVNVYKSIPSIYTSLSIQYIQVYPVNLYKSILSMYTSLSSQCIQVYHAKGLYGQCIQFYPVNVYKSIQSI